MVLLQNHNLERALDWIFSHPEFEEDSDFVIEMENNANANIVSEAKPEGPRVKDGSGSKSLGIIAIVIHVLGHTFLLLLSTLAQSSLLINCVSCHLGCIGLIKI